MISKIKFSNCKDKSCPHCVSTKYVITPTFREKTIYLNNEKTSYIKIIKLKEEDGLTMRNVDCLWENKYRKKLKWVEKVEIDDPIGYKPSGYIERIIADAKLLNRWCKALISFYESDDDIRKIPEDQKEITKPYEILSYSFGPTKRYLTLKPKQDGEYIKVKLSHNVKIILHCTYMKTHHLFFEKLRSKNKEIKRINITFRRPIGI